MARILSEKDLEILRKLAPELNDPVCPGSGHEFHSILPPVSNHFAEDTDDFMRRIRKLGRDEMEYLLSLILDGSESLGCMPPEDVEAFIGYIAETISPDAARKIVALYEAGECSP
jgi:hypothetical protein